MTRDELIELDESAGGDAYLQLDYEDGGALRCCICGGSCKQHWANGDVPDIGECCATMIAYASRMSGLSGNALRCRMLRSQMEARR